MRRRKENLPGNADLGWLIAKRWTARQWRAAQRGDRPTTAWKVWRRAGERRALLVNLAGCDGSVDSFEAS